MDHRNPGKRFKETFLVGYFVFYLHDAHTKSDKHFFFIFASQMTISNPAQNDFKLLATMLTVSKRQHGVQCFDMISACLSYDTLVS